MEKGWKEVFLTAMEYQAIIARDILERSGIKVVIMNQHDTIYSTFGEYVVYVPEESENLAIDLLKELKS
jgi:hypothetical protein